MSDIYKQGIKQRVRFQTSLGNLTIEQLHDLTVTQLNDLAVALDEVVAKGDKKSFIATPTKANELAKLKFDIAYDILQDKVKYAEIAAKAAETKEQNQKILAIIANKKDEALSSKSVEELEALLSQ